MNPSRYTPVSILVIFKELKFLVLKVDSLRQRTHFCSIVALDQLFNDKSDVEVHGSDFRNLCLNLSTQKVSCIMRLFKFSPAVRSLQALLAGTLKKQ